MVHSYFYIFPVIKGFSFSHFLGTWENLPSKDKSEQRTTSKKSLSLFIAPRWRKERIKQITGKVVQKTPVGRTILLDTSVLKIGFESYKIYN